MTPVAPAAPLAPIKPYLIRAIYEWCVDQGATPYLTVRVDERTRVPRQHVKGGEITLNIGPEASHLLHMGNDEITFQARFNGAAFGVVAPVNAVTAIFARENGQGMAFEALAGGDDTPADAPASTADAPDAGHASENPPAAPPPAKARPKLTRIK